MFSRFKKPEAGPAASGLKPVTSSGPVAPLAASAPKPIAISSRPAPAAPLPKTPAEAMAADKEK
ncbi:MAG: CpaF family protein, partial [Paracoccaceae bacterium]